jgi:hypothetical protein
MTKKRLSLLVRGLCASVLLGATFFAGAAYGQADALESAQRNIAEAIKSLKTLKQEGTPTAFEDHRGKAVELLTRAQSEVIKAKGAAPAQ